MFSSVSAALVPEALSLMRQRAPTPTCSPGEGSTHALWRSLRASTLDLAINLAPAAVSPPDNQDPPLELDVLLEGDLVVAVPASRSLGKDGSVTLSDLQRATWISSPTTTT